MAKNNSIQKKNFWKDENATKKVYIVGTIGALFLLVTFLFCAFTIIYCELSKYLFIFHILWSIIPPIWFWYEFFHLYREYGEDETFEYFKYAQQLSIAIWVGILASLSFLLSSNYFKESCYLF